MLVGLESERLIIGDWANANLADHLATVGDPKAREFFPDVLDAERAKAQMDHFAAIYAANGFSFLPLILKETDTHIGYMGLLPCDDDFGPDRPYDGVEIGWSLTPAFWGKGYATEMGFALIAYARDVLALKTLVTFTAIPNIKSKAVMLRLGFEPWGEFDMPEIEPGHWLRRHALYRLGL